MRALACLVLGLGLAGGGAFAQVPILPAPSFAQQVDAQARLEMLRAQQEFAARQQVILQNDISRLEAQLRAEQAFATLRAQSTTPAVPAPPASGALPSIDVSQIASIPDAKLAASNAAVKAAAENRP